MFLKYRSVILIIIFAHILLLVSCLFNNKYSEFSIENWNATDFSCRYMMAKDIVENDLLMGKTREDITTMLGEDGISDFYTSDKRLFYIVGRNYIDSIYLGILFNSDGVVEKTYIHNS